MPGFCLLEVRVLVSCRTISMVMVIGLLLLSGCASKRVYREPQIGPDPVAETSGDSPPATPPPAEPIAPGEAVHLGIRVATLAREQVGRPYRWGGESPGQGFDCSGLVHWSYGCVGIDLPRVVQQQMESGQSIDGDRLQPGDLVFFAMDGRSISHVGIYLGSRRFVHAPSSGQPVRVDSLDDVWWHGRWTDSRRVIRS